MECSDCREDLLSRNNELARNIKGIGNTLDSKLSLRNFGVACFCLAVPIFIYLITINLLIADCAEKDKVQNFEKFVISQVTEIKVAVENNSKIFNNHILRAQKIQDTHDERIRKLEMTTNKDKNKEM